MPLLLLSKPKKDSSSIRLYYYKYFHNHNKTRIFLVVAYYVLSAAAKALKISTNDHQHQILSCLARTTHIITYRIIKCLRASWVTHSLTHPPLRFARFVPISWYLSHLPIWIPFPLENCNCPVSLVFAIQCGPTNHTRCGRDAVTCTCRLGSLLISVLPQKNRKTTWIIYFISWMT